MTTLYRPVLIESAEQAEALPEGAIMRSRTGSLCERGTIAGDPCIWEEGWLSIPDAIEHLAPLTALVPIEAEEETVEKRKLCQKTPDVLRRYVTGWQHYTAKEQNR